MNDTEVTYVVQQEVAPNRWVDVDMKWGSSDLNKRIDLLKVLPKSFQIGPRVFRKVKRTITTVDEVVE